MGMNTGIIGTLFHQKELATFPELYFPINDSSLRDLEEKRSIIVKQVKIVTSVFVYVFAIRI